MVVSVCVRLCSLELLLNFACQRQTKFVLRGCPLEGQLCSCLLVGRLTKRIQLDPFVSQAGRWRLETSEQTGAS